MTDMELAEEIEYAELCRFTQEQIRQIIAALRRGPERDPMDYFRKGRESVLRKNQSGCCCLFNEEDEIVSVCMAHKEWAERPPSGEMVMVPREPTEDMRIAGTAAMAREQNGVREIYRAMLSACEEKK